MTDRCLDRLRDENSLIWPMSAMFRAFSKALSCKDMGSDFMFLRTRVNSVSPRRNRSSRQLGYSPCRRTACRSGRGSALGPAWCRCQESASGRQFHCGVEDEVQFEAEEPAHLAALGQIGKHLVPVMR